MQLREYLVRQRLRELTAISQPSDFLLDDGLPVPLSRMADGDVSPYCFDFATSELICVSTSDLAQATFYYQAQRQQARTVIKVPFDVLPAAPASPTLLFSVGRCGSTLLQKAFELAGVCTVGEPDYFTQVSVPRQRHGVRKQVLKRAVGGATGLLPFPVIKLRAECTFAAPLIAAAFPEPRIVFVLRDPVDWAASVYRISQNRRTPNQIAATLRGLLLGLGSLTECHDVEILYYEDFQELTADYINQLLQKIGQGSPVNPSDVAQLASVDSQEGTVVSRAWKTVYPEDPTFRAAFRQAWISVRPTQLIDRLQLRLL